MWYANRIITLNNKKTSAFTFGVIQQYEGCNRSPSASYFTDGFCVSSHPNL